MKSLPGSSIQRQPGGPNTRSTPIPSDSSELSAQEARTGLEKHCVPGILVKDEMGELEFIKKSFSSDFCVGLVNSSFLRRKLPHILRVLTVPIPIRVNDKLVFPKQGYDPRFGTFLVDHAPALKEMTLERALEVFHNLYFDFCFTNDQSRTHALARLLTPFARGILGWTTRVPLWFFSANRPRAGKDYLAAITLLVYEGQAFEDMPLGKDAEETCKRIISAARNGRRFMHFSNCQFYLQDQYLTQAITNQIIGGRSLGTNNASSDLCLPNEMEFSLSGNVGMTHREDFENRMRKIELAYFEEDFNDRAFKNPFLHQNRPGTPRTSFYRRQMPFSKIGPGRDSRRAPPPLKAFPTGPMWSAVRWWPRVLGTPASHSRANTTTSAVIGTPWP